MQRIALSLLVCLALAACGDGSKPKQSAAKPIRMACRTIDEAAMKAQDIQQRLAEAQKAGTITKDEYAAHNSTLSDGFRAWSERQDLPGYCAALQRIVADTGFQ